MRCDADAAVADRRVRGHHLQRRDRDALPDRHGADRRAGPVLERQHEAGAFTRIVDPRRLAEPEPVDPRGELGRAELLRHRDRADVRRLGEDLLDTHHLGASRVSLADHAICNLDCGSEREPGRGRDDIVLECTGDCHDLERRAGLVRVSDSAVASRVGRRGGELVGVERRIVRHGQDGARARIHHYRCGTAGPELLHRSRENLFRVRLDLMVDRQCHVPPGPLGLRGDDVDRSAEWILDDRFEARPARERLVERALEPVEAVVVGAGETEDVRGNRPLRICAQLLGVEAEPGDLPLAQLLGLGRVGFACDVDESLRPVLQRWVERVGVETECLPHDHGGALGVGDVARVRVYRRRLLADRKGLTRAVVDRTSARWHLDRLAVLGARHLREPVVLGALHPGGAADRDDEEEPKGGEE